MQHHADQQTHGSYKDLMVELAIDFVIMYLVMYTMIAGLSDFYLNINNVYMTLMMVAPMAVVMLVAMRSMFPSKRERSGEWLCQPHCGWRSPEALCAVRLHPHGAQFSRHGI